jgi:predicted Zn-dependent protease
LKHKDSAHARYLCAKVHQELGQFGEAEEQVRAALKQEPENFLATLGLAAMLLRHDDAAALAEAGRLLDRAERLLTPTSEGSQQLDYAATRGVYLGLTGDTDRARGFLKAVLEKDGDHRVAREDLAVLEK